MTGAILRWSLVVCLLAAACAHACPLPDPSAGPPPKGPRDAKPEARIIRAGKSVRLTMRCDEPTLRALRAGERQLTLVVNAFDPPTAGVSDLIVSLVTEDGKKRHRLARLGIAPDQPFSVVEGDPPQRFLIPLEDHARLIEGPEICVEVGFDAASGKLVGGRAEVTLELVHLR
jgi:hypothetical protein